MSPSFGREWLVQKVWISTNKTVRRCYGLSVPSKTGRTLATMAALSSALCLWAMAQYSINWYTIDGGGGTSTEGAHMVSGTIGQPDAGPALSG